MGGVAGTCVGLVTGQTCQVGCQDGFDARGRTFTTCVGAINSNSSYYSVPFFECIAHGGGSPRHDDDRGHRRHDDDDDNGDGDGDDGHFNVPPVQQPLTAWVCPRAGSGSCRPSKPVAVRTASGRSVDITWVALGLVTPNGETVSHLKVSIQPASGGFYYSSEIAGIATVGETTIQNLQLGQKYTFKLVVMVNGAWVASDGVTA